MAIKSSGDLQILSNVWNASAVAEVDYTACRLAYNGTNGNGIHGTVLFYNSGGYTRMVGRCYMYLGISQNHSGYFDFYCSRYGGGVQNQHNSNWTDVAFVSNLGGNANHNGFVWYNTNSNSWGDGNMVYRVEAWSGSLESGRYNLSHSSGYYNYQGFTGQSASAPFARRLN